MPSLFIVSSNLLFNEVAKALYPTKGRKYSGEKYPAFLKPKVDTKASQANCPTFPIDTDGYTKYK